MLYVMGVVGTSLLGDVVITAFARHLLYPILIAVKNETFGFFCFAESLFYQTNKEHFMEALFENVMAIEWGVFWKQLLMWAIGGVLIFLAIKKKMEPTLLLPMGFGAILMNIPNNLGIGGVSEVLQILSRSSSASPWHSR